MKLENYRKERRGLRSLREWTGGRLAIGSIVFILCLFGFIFFGRISGKLEVHNYGQNFEIAAAAVGGWFLVISLCWAKREKRFDLFEPPLWLTANYYFQVIGNIWVFQRDRVPTIPWVRQNLSEIATTTVLLYGLAITAMWAGYWLGAAFLFRKRNSRRQTEMRLNTRRSYWIWFFCWLVGTGAVFIGVSGYLGIRAEAAGRWLNYVHFISIIGAAVSIALIMRVFGYPTLMGKLWFIGLVATQVGLSLLMGSKAFLLVLVLYGMAIYYSTGRLPYRLFVLALVAMLVVFPVVSLYRSNLHAAGGRGGVALAQRLSALSDAIVDTVSRPVRTSLETTGEVIKKRQGQMFDISASALVIHPDRMPFVGSDTISGFVSRLIPRVFWPGKPLERPSLLMITTTYGGAASEYSFSEIGLVADSYRNGGFVGAVVMFFILGLALAWLYWQGPMSHSLFGVVLFLTVQSQIVVYYGDFATTIINLLQFGPLIWFVLYFSVFSRKGPERWHLAVLDGESGVLSGKRSWAPEQRR